MKVCAIILTALAIGLVPLATTSSATSPLTPAAPGVVAEETYAIDPAQVRADFLATGHFRFRLPVLGEVEASGVDTALFADTTLVPVDAATGALGTPTPMDAITFQGTLVGHPDSHVRLLLGAWGLHGVAVWQGSFYDLHPAGPGLQTVVEKRPDLAGKDLAAVVFPALDVRALTVTNVAYYVDYGYQNTHPDWYDRVGSAFSEMYNNGLWQSVDIDMHLPTIYYVTGSNIVTSTDSGVAIGQWRTYLSTHLISGIRAYEIWTSLDMDGASTYGRSNGVDTGFNEYASAVVEGTNYWGDLYDANSAYERGIVSGHEFSHIYGEEHEVDGCGFWDCNIMQYNTDNSFRAFWWTDSSKSEIRCRFYSNLEYGLNC